jgi:hypothetical protein
MRTRLSLVGIVGFATLGAAAGCDRPLPNPGPSPPGTPLVLTSVVPSHGLIGEGLSIFGTGLQYGATITVGGVRTPPNRFGGNLYHVTAPSHVVGSVDVVVTNKDGQSATLIGGFTYAALTLTTSVDCVLPGAEIKLEWMGPDGRSEWDWIAFFKVGADSTEYLDSYWDYTRGSATGWRRFTAPPEPGSYEFRYFVDNGLIAAATSAPVRVVEASCESMAGLSFRRRQAAAGVERQAQRSESDGVAVEEIDGALQAILATIGAVLAAEVFETGASVGDDQARVPPRDRGGVEPDRDIGVATDDVQTGDEGKSLAFPFQPARRRSGGDRAPVRGGRRLGAERIAVAVHGSDELWRAGEIAERLANLRNEIGEVGFDYESVSPESVLQFFFGDRLGPLSDEERQELKSLRGEVNDATGAGQLPRFEVEDKWREVDSRHARGSRPTIRPPA